MGRPPCCDKSNVKKGLWTPEEDAKILAYVSTHGIGNWTLVPKIAGLNRCGKSCRLRWTNYLRPDLKHDGFTPQEEDLIIDLHQAVGSRWSLIAKQLPGRTDNDVKNYWNTKLRKKLLKMGIDPVTHKPVSQVISEFGNVSSLPNASNRIRSFNNNIVPVLPKTPQPPPRIPNNNISYPQVISNNTTNYYENNNNNNNVVMQPSVPFFNDQVNSTCSSSASSPLVSQLNSPPAQPLWQQPSYVAQVTPTSDPFSWNEFLLCDPLFSVDFQNEQQLDLQRLMPTVTNNSQANNFVQNDESYSRSAHDGVRQTSQHAAASCSSTSSFVEAILDRDTEIRSQFPNLMGGCFDY
ncbi:hypothetical protein ACFE04_006849 [Oxalis oulophora]